MPADPTEVSLFDAIASGRPLVADGAMGTELQRAGLEPGACGDEWSLAHPDRVEAIHRAYVDAGAQIVLTCTFGTNRFVLSRYGLESRVSEIAAAAAANARRAAAARAWVLGDVGPSGGLLPPLGEVEPAALEDTWREAMSALLGAGVDGILIETMSALEELLLAIGVARELGAPLVIASMSYDAVRSGGFRTIMGVAPEMAGRAIRDAGAHVIGANCGRMEPEAFVPLGRVLRESSGLPVMLQPNAGQPRLDGERIVYPRAPEDLAPALVALTAEASIVGGCCGSTPDHIRAFTRALGRTGP